ncbi:MAG: L,D-transpeptidase family protein [Sphingomonas sp.]|nr:L,D-transpeptidase family protein [Sphingomonas sp.]
MKPTLIRSAVAAASLLSIGTASAGAQTLESAIATGMAIPIPGLPQRTPPVPARGRAVVVDAASARLFMIENGEVVDSMRVIVGKPTTATPTMRSTLFYATLNPYWNVPTDLARTLIAPHVLEQGMTYLTDRGYEVVTNFSRDAQVIPAASVDWQAVASGQQRVFVRQRPGPANSMGQMKFGFDNSAGIFLHDTPKKELFAQDDRSLSNGCVRLEDAPRFARWLLGHDPQLSTTSPEQFVALPGPVPIVITYLDAGAAAQVAALR